MYVINLFLYHTFQLLLQDSKSLMNYISFADPRNNLDPITDGK